MTLSIPVDYKNRISGSLHQVLNFAKDKGYAGYSKFDALNSPFLEDLFGWHPLLRLIIVQAVNRIPINLRRISGVKTSRNPKGIGNFLKALSNVYEIDPDEGIKSEIEKLAAWVMENHSNKKNEFSGICWGYNFAWQSPGFYAPRYFPNAIVTVFCAEGLLRAYQVLNNRKYLEMAVNASLYLLKDLPILEEDENRKCIGYVTAPLNLKVININSVIAGFLAKLSQATGEKLYLEDSRKLLNWIIEVKTDYYAWYYTHPPTAYVRNHDNYHTGGILDGIFDYMDATGDYAYLETYMKGLKFYSEELFEHSGAPKWRNTKSLPYDIHGSAQGILSFAKAARYNPFFLDTAVKQAVWAIENLQSLEGGFYYQKHRLFTWKLDLMRWNNSWMAWALSELLLLKKSNV